MSSKDFEVTRDLRASIDRIWAEAIRLGIFSIDTPVRQRLREFRSTSRRHPALRKKTRPPAKKR